MGQRTALYQSHADMNAKLVDFGGWDMPLHYGSQVEEHHKVRSDAGMFDVSHMTVVDIEGPQAREGLRRLLANDVAKLDTLAGKALYTGMLNQDGGVIDDLIVYNCDWASGADGTGLPSHYRLVVNCATREKDLAWINSQLAGDGITINERPELGIIALQGPNALAKVGEVLVEHAAVIQGLKPFQACAAGDLFIGRTGYTGEDGVEIILPAEAAVELWQKLHAAGVAPAGLGARDTLRLEAGMNLYGHEMDEAISPLQANMAWTVAWQPEERDFIGRAALEKQKAEGVKEKLVGLLLEGRGVLRAEMKVISEAGEGVSTSGGFSPTLGQSIGLARVPVATGASAEVEVRGKRLAVRVIGPGFVRNGKKTFE